jgi:hypothetical protein
MLVLLRRRSSVPASYGRPPGSPSNPTKIVLSRTITFSPTLHPRKSFSRNTYAPPRKCCKQKTYAKAKSFRCNTYKKQGWGSLVSSALNLRSSTKIFEALSFHAFTNCLFSISFLLIFIHVMGGLYPLRLHFLPSCATMSAARCPKSKPRGTK